MVKKLGKGLLRNAWYLGRLFGYGMPELSGEPAEEIERTIVEAMARLSHAITNRDPLRVCELSRGLADEVDHAFSHPELWHKERVDKVVALLKEAAEVTAETEYYANCAVRPKTFILRLDALVLARKSLDQIRDIERAAETEAA